ncbi:HTH_48 domain-containing protein [Trichonephila clavipes]|nr:HTH_48 domain-containing protein [Trichonephila clavipes]
MVFALQNSTIKEQRSVVRFLTAEGEKLEAIRWWMVSVYGEKCVSDMSVRKWIARFRVGRESMGDDKRPANVGSEGGCQLWNRVDNCSQQVGISEGVCRLGFEAANRPAKGTAMELALQHLFRY